MSGRFVYVDTSVVLAHILAEDATPPCDMWDESLISSRLLEYETWNRLRARGCAETHGHLADGMLRLIAFLELVEPVVGSAARRIEVGLRTLDALHLASMLWLVGQGVELRLASYDRRLSAAADAHGVSLFPL